MIIQEDKVIAVKRLDQSIPSRSFIYHRAYDVQHFIASCDEDDETRTLKKDSSLNMFNYVEELI